MAQEAIGHEVKALSNLQVSIDLPFAAAVDLIANCSGRLLVTGVGKSAIIGRKIVATFNSINIPAAFLHAADALHGDLGALREKDVVICLSKSGNTPEIKSLIPLIKAKGNSIIAIVSKTDSFLANEANIIIETPVEKEADPLNLTPTVSTILQLAVGDALAICLMNLNEFKPDEFAELHPGGMLGKRLNLAVGDIGHLNEIPAVFFSDPIEKVIVEISSKRLGATAVLDNDQKILGIITDGDLRRMLQREGDYRSYTAGQVMSTSPKIIPISAKAIEAFDIMRRYNITQLLVTGDEGKYQGVIHIHDLLKEGF